MQFLKHNLLLILTLAAVLVACSDDKKSANTNGVDQSEFPSAKTLATKLGKGINLGNALDAPTEGEWGVTLKEDYFQLIADSGFNTVRLPVRWSAHAMEKSPYTIDSVFMNRVKWAVDQALSRNLNVVMDMHHYQELMVDPQGQEERFLAMWKQIAKEFEEYPAELVFEILNEAKDSLDATAWNKLLVKAIDTIRVNQPGRSLMVGTAPWGGLDGLQALQLPDDSNLIVTVHYYEPHQFTHQGASFEAGADVWLGQTWRATPAQRSKVDNAMLQIAAWSKEHNRPVFLGEFGTYYRVDSTSRAFYTEYMVHRMDSLGISWALWNFSSDFGIYNDSTEEVHQYLTQAMLHPGHNTALDSAVQSGVKIDMSKFVLIDDFDGHDDFKGITATGWKWIDSLGVEPDSSSGGWYAFYSAASKIESAKGDSILNIQDIIQNHLETNIGKAITTDGYTGNGFHIKVHLKGSSYPYIGFGAGFTGWDNPSDYFDLCSITAVSFRAKGKGSWALQLITDTVDNHYANGEDWGNFQTEFTLTDQWEEVVIPANELVPKPWSQQETDGLTWKDGCKHTNAIEFQNAQSYGAETDSELEFAIDDIRLIGITKMNINPPVWNQE